LSLAVGLPKACIVDIVPDGPRVCCSLAELPAKVPRARKSMVEARPFFGSPGAKGFAHT